MSDSMRQSNTDKLGSAVKPDSQKSMVEKAGDTVKGTADSAASTLQPQSEKSTSQKATDSVSGNSNESSESMLDQAKGALGMNK